MIEFNPNKGVLGSLYGYNEGHFSPPGDTEIAEFFKTHLRELTQELRELPSSERKVILAEAKKINLKETSKIVEKCLLSLAPTRRSKPVLQRQISEPLLGTNRGEQTEEELVAGKQSEGSLWNCINCSHDRYAGHLYTFIIKPKFINPDAADEQNAELFPAIQRGPAELMNLGPLPDPINLGDIKAELADLIQSDTEFQFKLLLCGFKIEQTDEGILIIPPPLCMQDLVSNRVAGRTIHNEDLIQYASENSDKFSKHSVRKDLLELRDRSQVDLSVRRDLLKLGFKLDSTALGISLTLPDREALLSRWQKLQEEDASKRLPDLHIASSEGIADDMPFVSMVIASDFVLSNNVEFIHDITVHALPVLSQMLSSSSYDTDKYRLVQACASLVQAYYRTDRLVHEKSENLSPEFIDGFIKMREQVKASIGVYVDAGSVFVEDEPETPSADVLSGNWHTEEWSSYWIGRFSEIPPSVEALKQLDAILKQMIEINEKANFSKKFDS